MNAHAVDWVGSQDNSWITNNAGITNWSGNVIPTAGDDVTIDASLVGGEILFDFEEGVYRNLTIEDSANLGTSLELRINGAATTTATPGFGAANGLLLIKAGVGAVTVNQDPNAGDYGLNDSNITLEDGVLGDFTILAGSNRQRFHDFIGDSVITSTFTNNSDQFFNIRMRDGETFDLTLHSDVNGTPGEFTLSRSGNAAINVLHLTGDARLDSSSTATPVVSSEIATEITNTGGLSNFLVSAGDTTVAGRVTGNLNLAVETGGGAAISLTNDDTYVGTTTLGGGGSNANRGIALIREGSHIGGGDYVVTGGLSSQTGRIQEAVLGGSGLIELQNEASLTLDRTAHSNAFRARATLAPGNTGWDSAGVNTSTGAVSAITLGNQAIGTLTVSADEVVFGDYSRYEAQLNGPDSDLLDILAGTGGNTNAGDLDLSSTLNELFIDADLLGDADGTTYTLISWEGTRTGMFDTVWLQDQSSLFDMTADSLTGFQIDGIDYKLVYGANTLQLVGPAVNAAVPEPSSFALWALLGLTCGLGSFRRRRRG
jgi:hypothetical protein